MATKLDKTLKREIEIDGQPYTVALSADGVKLTQKGFRKGREITWRELARTGAEEDGGAGAGGGQSGAGRTGAGGGMGGGMGSTTGYGGTGGYGGSMGG